MRLLTGTLMLFFSFGLCASSLNHVIHSMPEISYTLYIKSSWPSGDGNYHERENGFYPLSDRTTDAISVYFKQSKESVIIASWDMHDINLPLSTLFGNNWHLRGYYLANHDEILIHDAMAAEYIAKIFKAGAKIVMLKGVPDDHDERFTLFCDLLDSYAKENGINLDIELLKKTRYIDKRKFKPSFGLLCKMGECHSGRKAHINGKRYEITTRLGNQLSLINVYYEDHNSMQSLMSSRKDLNRDNTVVIFGTGRFYYSNNPEDDERLMLIKTLPGIVHTVLQNPNQHAPTNNLPPEDLTFLLSNHSISAIHHNELKNMASLENHIHLSQP